MRRLINIVLASLVFGAFTFAPVISYAATETTPKTDDKIQQSLKTRIDKYIINHPQNLTNVQILRLKNFCKLAQDKTKVHTTNAVKKTEDRLKVYNKMDVNLKALITKIKDKKANDKVIDTTKIDALMVQLDAAILKFKTDASTYQVSLNDLSTMDCQSDPTSFKAALEEARADHVIVVADSDAIFKLTKEDIKTELKTIKDAMADVKTTDKVAQ